MSGSVPDFQFQWDSGVSFYVNRLERGADSGGKSVWKAILYKTYRKAGFPHVWISEQADFCSLTGHIAQKCRCCGNASAISTIFRWPVWNICDKLTRVCAADLCELSLAVTSLQPLRQRTLRTKHGLRKRVIDKLWFYLNKMIGLTMCSVAWNRFHIKNLWLIPCFFHLSSEVTWMQICANLNHRKKMKAEPSRLIPLKQWFSNFLRSRTTWCFFNVRVYTPSFRT